MSKLPRPIPDSVLKLLRHRWKVAEPDYSAFQSVFDPPFEPFGDDPEAEQRDRHAALVRNRRLDPSCYYTPIDGPRSIEAIAGFIFTHPEAVALICDAVFGTAAEDEGSRIVINEHAQHALEDFCQEVYGAWAKYLDRLARIERACPPISALRERHRAEATEE
jgi:hypothetical protein